MSPGESSPDGISPVQQPADSPYFTLEFQLNSLVSNLCDLNVALRLQKTMGEPETAAAIAAQISETQASIESLRLALYVVTPPVIDDPRY